MSATALLAACLVLALGAPLHASSRSALDPKQIAALERGEVLELSRKVAGSRVMLGKAIGIIEDVPEAVLHVLLAVDRYKHFLPRVTESRITRRRGWHTYAVIHSSMPWPVKNAWVYFKLTRTDRPKRVFKLKWHMLNGTMKSWEGSALIEPWTADGKRSLVTYKLLAEPRTAAPDSLISSGVKRVTATILHRVRLRLAALRKFKRLPRGM